MRCGCNPLNFLPFLLKITMASAELRHKKDKKIQEKLNAIGKCLSNGIQAASNNNFGKLPT